ncbi:MAG: Glu/Leu/Phe/Val dehydrogenase, partial [Methylocystis sp.]|nr:Glu/Leu/Phe/Val dehydrogenase [Methylocystis sp.]
FGAVGRHAARFLARKGARLVGVADRQGAIADAAGLDIEALIRLKRRGRSVVNYQPAAIIDAEALVALPCDIWIPAARPDVLRADNVDRLDCKLVVQGANIPATPDAEKRMFERGIMSLPDFIANAGGVICGAVEFGGGAEAEAFTAIKEKIGRNTREILERARDKHVSARDAASEIVKERLRKLMAFRRWRQ